MAAHPHAEVGRLEEQLQAEGVCGSMLFKERLLSADVLAGEGLGGGLTAGRPLRVAGPSHAPAWIWFPFSSNPINNPRQVGMATL